jgi:hypothetical protein
MPLPSINITFTSTAASAVVRGERGIVAMILRDATFLGADTITTSSDIPATLSTANKEQINFALYGGQKPPLRVEIYALATAAADLSAAKAYFETIKWDYMVLPWDCSAGEITDGVTWIKGLRTNLNKMVKSVIAATVADSEAIVNYNTNDAKIGSTTYTAKKFCARIAGILAGTPLTISATYQTLPDVTDITTRLTKTQLDSAIDAGKLEIFHDGVKVKIARAVNSLTTTTADKSASFKKIKIVDTYDLIYTDIKTTVEDNYIGKYANSYDNKIVLITAINGYLDGLVAEGLLDPNFDNKVMIDVDAQKTYLEGVGVDTSVLSVQEIKEYNTADKVFISGNIKALDAMEDITLALTV